MIELYDAKMKCYNNKSLGDKHKDIFLVVNHPITEESEKAGKQMEILLKSLQNFDAQFVLIMPNSDAGSINTRKILSFGAYSLFNRKKYKAKNKTLTF